MGRQGKGEDLVLVQTRVPKRVRDALVRFGKDDRRTLAGLVRVVLEDHVNAKSRDKKEV